MTPEVSIIIPVHNEGVRLRETIDAIAGTADVPYEVVVVDDVSADGCCDDLKGVRLVRLNKAAGVAGARNAGASLAQAPVLLFLDGHCYPEVGWLSACVDTLRRLGRGIVGPCISVHGDPTARGYGMQMNLPGFGAAWMPKLMDAPYPVPFTGGCGMLFHRAFFEQLGGFDQMRTYGLEDLEIAMRAWLFGGQVHVVPYATVAHYFRTKTTCEIQWPVYVYNVLRFALLHFDGEHLDALLAHWRKGPGFDEAWQALARSNIHERAAEFRRLRVRDARWFCDRFNLKVEG